MMETKDIELKPCPFCGNKDVVLVTVPTWPRPHYELICRNCNAVIQAKDKESVHDLWNRRYEPPNEPLTLKEQENASMTTSTSTEIVHCRDCTHLYFKDFSAFCPFRVESCKPNGFCDKGERRDKE